LMAGTKSRARAIAQEFCVKKEVVPTNLSKKAHRYALFSVGPVVTVSHGIGEGSILVLLHELAKALYYAHQEDGTSTSTKDWRSIPWIRVGSCGGLGIEPGTIVVTSQPVNGLLRPCVMELSVLGQRHEFPARLDEGLTNRIYEYGQKDEWKVLRGNTFCCPDFYESQARRDGAIGGAPHTVTVEEQKEFLRRLSDDHGVVNIEMESLPLAYFGTCLGIPTAVVAVALVDRLTKDTSTEEGRVLAGWIERPVKLAVGFVKETVLC